jgi:hypothetical protein
VGEGKFVVVNVNRLKKVHTRRSVPAQTQQTALTEEVNPLKLSKPQVDRTATSSIVPMDTDCVPTVTRSREQAVQEDVEDDYRGNELGTRARDKNPRLR